MEELRPQVDVSPLPKVDEETVSVTFSPGIFRNKTNRQIETLTDFGVLRTCFRAILVLLLRIGFTMIQVGTIPTKCTYTMVLHNLLDMSIVTICFTFIGFIIAFGRTSKGIIGTQVFITNIYADMDEAVFGVCACIIGSAIITTLTADRVHIICFVTVAVLASTIIQPLLMHWIWNPDGWLAANSLFSERVSIKDHAGCLVIHYSMGLFGLIGAVILGGRLIKLSTIHDCSVTRSSVITVPLGYFLVYLGLMGFTLTTPEYQSHHEPTNLIALLFMNQIVALTTGMLTMILLQIALRTRIFDYWKVLRVMQGGIAGLVAVSAGVDVYSPLSSFFIALFVTIFVHFALILIFRTTIEDYCNIGAVHVIAAAFGILLPALFGEKQNLGFAVSVRMKFIHFTWQFIGLLVASIMALIFLAIYLLCSKLKCLRSGDERENHNRSLEVERIEKKKLKKTICDPYENVPYFEPGFSSRTIPVPGPDGTVIGGFMGFRGSTTRITTLKKKREDKKGKSKKKDKKAEKEKEKIARSLSFA